MVFVVRCQLALCASHCRGAFVVLSCCQSLLPPSRVPPSFLLVSSFVFKLRLQQPSTNKLVLPLCRTCDILLPVNFGCNSVLLVLAVVYAWRHYNASDADVYMDALARIDLPHDTRFRRVARLLGRDRVLVGTAIGAALVESGANLAFNVLWGSMVDEIESGDKASLNSVSEALGVAACGIGLAVFAGNWCSIVAGAHRWSWWFMVVNNRVTAPCCAAFCW